MIAEGDEGAFLADVGAVVVAAYDFQPEADDELDVKAGTRLRTLDLRDEWWLARTEDGTQEGLIPVSYVMSEAEYEEMQRVASGEIDVDEVDLADLDFAPLPTSAAADAAAASADSAASAPVSPPEAEQSGSAGTEEVQQPTPPPPPPPPEAAEAAFQAVVAGQEASTGPSAKEDEELGDAEYEELSAKFAALQKRVAEVQLTAAAEAAEEAAVVAAAEAAGAAATPPPPSPAEAAAALQRSSQRSAPPSAQDAAQALAQEAAGRLSSRSAPPSAEDAAEAWRQEKEEQARQRAEAEWREAARIAQEEEESRRKAQEMRARFDEDARRQRDAMAVEEVGDERLRHVAQAKAPRRPAASGPSRIDLAVAAVKQAVAMDGEGKYAEAYLYYVKALQHFAAELEGGGSGKASPQLLVERMRNYLERMSALEPAICTGTWSDGEKKRPGQRTVARFTGRAKLLATMARATGMELLPPAEDLRLQGRFAETSGDQRASFRFYSEALEYFMAFRELEMKAGRKVDPEVMESMTQSLDAAERLKKAIS